MPRKYKKMDQDELMQKLFSFCNDDELFIKDLLSYPSVQKDIGKVSFSLENVIPEKLTSDFHPYFKDYGLCTVGDFSFFGLWAGGDWQHPVFFILYWYDDKKLRAYIPKDGNQYHKKEKRAYTSKDERPDSGVVVTYDFEEMKRDIIQRFGVKTDA